jgi:hypothetical protein
MAAAFIEAFGVGIGIGVAIAIGSRLYRITIANPDTDSDSEYYGLSLFSEQSLSLTSVCTRCGRRLRHRGGFMIQFVPRIHRGIIDKL